MKYIYTSFFSFYLYMSRDRKRHTSTKIYGAFHDLHSLRAEGITEAELSNSDALKLIAENQAEAKRHGIDMHRPHPDSKKPELFPSAPDRPLKTTETQTDNPSAITQTDHLSRETQTDNPSAATQTNPSMPEINLIIPQLNAVENLTRQRNALAAELENERLRKYNLLYPDNTLRYFEKEQMKKEITQQLKDQPTVVKHVIVRNRSKKRTTSKTKATHAPKSKTTRSKSKTTRTKSKQKSSKRQ